jgi:DNA excision repair protein ERCC-4
LDDRKPTESILIMTGTMPLEKIKGLKIPVDLKPEQLVGIIDTREQTPVQLEFPSTRGTLSTGDYSIQGLEHVIAIERKSLSDLLGCIGTERERFERELQRMLAYPTRAVVVESEWDIIEAGEWSSRVTPASAIGSILAWMTMGIPFIFAGTHERAGIVISRMLFIAARRRYRENRSLMANILTPNTNMEGDA